MNDEFIVVEGINLIPIDLISKRRTLNNYIDKIERNRFILIQNLYYKERTANIFIKNIAEVLQHDKYLNSDLKIQEIGIKELLFLDIRLVNDILIPPFKIYNNVYNSLKPQEKEILILRSEKKTLQEIGEDFGVTRERIRQIESQSLKRFNGFFQSLFCSYTNEFNFLDLDLDTLDLSTRDKAIVELIISRNRIVEWDSLTNKYFIRRNKEDELLNSLIKNILNVPILREKDINEFVDEFASNGYAYIDKETIEKLLKRNKYYKAKNDWVSFNKVATPYLYIIQEYFPKGIELFSIRESEDYKEMVSLALKTFPKLGPPTSVRSLYARLEEQLIAIDRSIMVSPEQFRIDNNLIEEILEDIDDSQKPTFYFSEIYIKYKERLEASNIHNRYALRSALLAVNDYDYDYDRDTLTKKGRKKEDLELQIENFVKSAKTVVDNEEIREKFKHYTYIQILGVIYRSKRIINWGHARNIHVENIPLIKNKNEMIKKLLKETEELNYISTKTFIDIFNEDNNIHSFQLQFEHDIQYLINKEFKDYFVYKEGLIWDINHVIDDNLSRVLYCLDKTEFEEISLRELERFNNRYQIPYKFTRWSLNILTNRLLRQNSEKFFPFNTKVTEQLIEVIESQVRELLKNKPFVSISNIFKNIYLPLDYFHWSPETVASFMEIYLSHIFDFHKIGNDLMLTTFGVITLKDQYQDSAHAIYTYFEMLGMEETTEHELYKYLIQESIISSGIPEEFYFDEYVRVSGGRIYIKNIVEN